MSESSNDMPQLNIGDIVTGTVVKVEEKQVLVDVGYKTEGIVPISELSSLHIEQASDIAQADDEIELYVKRMEDDEVILSKKAVDAEKAWESLEEQYNNGDVFETEVKEIVKGGLVADVGVRGFIPASLVETYYVDDFSDYINQPLRVKIVDLDREQNRVILSHKDVVQDELNEKKQEVLQSLEEGQVLEGVVERITNFGVFVNLGGIDGLVHISQLAHEHVEKASDVVSEGDTVNVEVLSVDRDNERISLSRKRTLPGPWANIEDRVSQGDILEGTVKRLVNFGAFVEVFPGVEGLVHISQIANRHIGTPQEVLEVGEEINVKVLDVSQRDERISLSIKELEQEQEASDVKEYQKDDDEPGFQLGDFIGDKLDKYK
ncbi:30S ribosomal protein S1 [Lentibacillus halophilus]|uniref:30S ribosomal protein S1 n=1 Tax=Lentibacillus halophilus TaxID=295065 RepID=A0ABN0ZDE8_9BACI